MKKYPLGCRTVWLNSSTTRWTTGSKLRILTQQKTQAGISSIRTQLLVDGTFPLPKGAARCQNMRRKLRRACTFSLFRKEEHPWFYFFSTSPLLALVSSSSAGFLFSDKRKPPLLLLLSRCYLQRATLEKKIFSCYFLFLEGTMLTCNQSPVNPARGRKKTLCKQIQWRWEKTEEWVVLFYLLTCAVQTSALLRSLDEQSVTVYMTFSDKTV